MNYIHQPLFEHFLEPGTIGRLVEAHRNGSVTNQQNEVYLRASANTHLSPYSEKMLAFLFNLTCFKYCKMGKKLNGSVMEQSKQNIIQNEKLCGEMYSNSLKQGLVSYLMLQPTMNPKMVPFLNPVDLNQIQ